MPFIDKSELLFVHIPKTGGSSIEQKFNIHNINDEVDTGEYFYDLSSDYFLLNYHTYNCIFASHHFIPKLIKEHNPERYEKYKKFTIIRNPYTRCISEYFFREHKSYFDDGEFHNWFKKFCCDNFICDHYLPQVEYFNEIDYDHVIKFENLENDFNNMCDLYNIPKGLPLVNSSSINTNDLVDKLSSNSIDAINSRYHRDFTDLGYKFM